MVQGRSNRRQYWLLLGGAWLVQALLGPYLPGLLPVVFGAVWLGIYARRLHDLGLSGWWAVGGCVLALLLVLPVALLPEVLAHAFGIGPRPAPAEAALVWGMVALGVGVCLGGTVLLGVLRGEPGVNRWGLAPGGSIERRPLAL